jgi:hypothetical protein
MMRDADATEKRKKMLPWFCEEEYTQKPVGAIPAVKVIYQFLKQVFEVGQFNPECCVISLVYINRLIGVTGVPLTQSNWKPGQPTATATAGALSARWQFRHLRSAAPSLAPSSFDDSKFEIRSTSAALTRDGSVVDIFLLSNDPHLLDFARGCSFANLLAHACFPLSLRCRRQSPSPPSSSPRRCGTTLR